MVYFRECCCEQWKREFKINNCLLEHSPPEDLVRSQWQTTSRNIIFLLYRWIIALFFTSAVIVSIYTFSFAQGKYLIYLTNWGIIMCMISTLLGAYLVTKWHFQKDYYQMVQLDDMPKTFKVYWCLHNTALTLSVIISIIYWAILHSSEILPMNAANIMTHACNSIIMFLDVLIVAYPIRLYHVIQPIALGILYVIFSVIYYFVGGTDLFGNTFIYFVLDWNKPGMAFVTVIGTIVLAFIVHTILFWIYQLRMLIFKNFIYKKTIPKTTTISPASTSISMVLGSYQNKAFTASNEKIDKP